MRSAREIWTGLELLGKDEEAKVFCVEAGIEPDELAFERRSEGRVRGDLWLRLSETVSYGALARVWGINKGSVSSAVKGARERATGQVLPARPRDGERPLPIWVSPTDETTPGLRRGEGERRSCMSEVACLDAFVKGPGRKGADGRCARQCTAYVPLKLSNLVQGTSNLGEAQELA